MPNLNLTPRSKIVNNNEAFVVRAFVTDPLVTVLRR
jgi:hypothetical protein